MKGRLVASIGMACGAAFYQLTVISTAAAILVLLGLGSLAKTSERRADNRKSKIPAEKQQ